MAFSCIANSFVQFLKEAIGYPTSSYFSPMVEHTLNHFMIAPTVNAGSVDAGSMNARVAIPNNVTNISAHEQQETAKKSMRKLYRKSPKWKIGRWVEEEDRLLKDLYQQHGPKWSLISKSIGTRGPKQCRDHWINSLNPEAKNTAWTTEEEEILLLAHTIFKNSWVTIAMFLPGRTGNAVKNHWNGIKRKVGRGTASNTALANYIGEVIYGSSISEGASDPYI